MTDPYAQLEQLIQSADAANAKFAQAEADAAKAHDAGIETYQKEATKQKREEENFWLMNLKEADQYYVDLVSTELGNIVTQQTQKTLYSKLKPSNAVEDWELSKKSHPIIVDAIHEARQAIYDSIYHWQDEQRSRRTLRQILFVCVGVATLFAVVLGVQHQQEQKRQQERQQFTKETSEIIGNSEILIYTDSRVYRITQQNTQTWAKSPQFQVHCIYITPSIQTYEYYCLNYVDKYILNTFSDSKTSLRANDEISISSDGNSTAIYQRNNIAITTPFGTKNIPSPIVENIVWASDNQQFAYSESRAIYWYKNNELLGIYYCSRCDDLAFTTDSRRLAFLDEGTLRFLIPDFGILRQDKAVLLKDAAPRATFALSPDGRYIIYNGYDNHPYILEIETDRLWKFPEQIGMYSSKFVWAALPPK